MIAERLRALRISHGLTQRDLAGQLNLTRGAVGAYEQGRRTPSLDILLKLAEYYQTSSDYILGLSDEPEPPPALDLRGREILSCYLSHDEQGRALIYNQHLFLEELLRYGEHSTLPGPPAFPAPSPSENRK